MSIKKMFIIVSNSESDVFLCAMRQQSDEPKILYLKTSKYGRQSIIGDLLESNEARNDLLDLLNRN